MKEALNQIAQMSDCGSPELAIVRMKEIAVNALKEPTEEKRNEGMKVDVLQEAYKYRDAISAEMEPLIPQSISPESREYHLDGIVKGYLRACQQFKLIQTSPSPDKPEQ